MTDDGGRVGLRRIETVEGRDVYYDADTGTYHAWYGEDSYEPVSTALIFTVSSVLGVEPTDLDVLAETVDPDALNSIFVHWRGDEPRVGDGRLSFTYANCEVTVHSDGELVIDPRRHGNPSP